MPINYDTIQSMPLAELAEYLREFTLSHFIDAEYCIICKYYGDKTKCEHNPGKCIGGYLSYLEDNYTPIKPGLSTTGDTSSILQL